MELEDMRITNMLHFTENHRFCVNRDFSLSSLDYKMLTMMYQPMVGAYAITLYQTLSQQLSSEKTGYSSMEQQRRLFLMLELEQGERGRKYFIEQSSKLEAIGLLQTTRKYIASEEDYMYEYTLFAPLSPNEFFRNQHLTLLLRDKVGKFMLLALREELLAPEPQDYSAENAENLSVPFYELFQLNTQVVDYELEEALYEASAAKHTDPGLDVSTKGFQYADIIMRFPRESNNRIFVEGLKHKPEQLVSINITAKKYNLSLQETCRLLDEDGVFTEDGMLLSDKLQYNANLFYRQNKKRSEERERTLARSEANGSGGSDASQDEQAGEKSVEMQYYLEVPAQLRSECTDHQYNYILRNEPYTFVLKKFFTQGSIPDGVLNIFEKIDLNYKLKEEVINVLIHFLHIDRRSWAKSSIEAVASDMLGKQVASYEQAVEYVREKIRFKEKAASKVEAAKAGGGSATRGRQGKQGSQKPNIPIVQNTSQASRLTGEELEAMRKRAQKLDEKLNR
jgi:replication initiation and membrane attachment protein